MGTLLEYFRGRRERKIISKIKEHAKKAYHCVVLFNEALNSFYTGDLKATSSSIKRVNQVENECDKIRRSIMRSLTRGELSSQVRNDLAHLVGRLDNVANSANAAARRLSILKPNPIMDEISALLRKMVDKTLVCAEVLRDTIEIEIEGAIEKVDKSLTRINKLEHEVDRIHYELLSQLNQVESRHLSPFVAYNIFDLIENTEQISDYCEETADFVKIINLRAGKPT
jgi:predicted phosphate transport protein (TIGR00153 family)